MTTLFQPEALAFYEKMLDFTALRHTVIANNIANVNTPGYRRHVVHFKDELARAVADGDTERLAALRAEVRVSHDGPFRADGNNVNVERELADLMKNALLYRTCTELLSARIAGYRAAIRGHSATA